MATSKEPTVAELQAQLEQLTKLVEENQKEAARQSKEEAEKEKKARELDDYMEQYVEVKLFKDNDKYKDDVFVAVNGENCVIKRGERVKIKRKFAQVLDNSEHQDYETSKLIERAVGTKKVADL